MTKDVDGREKELTHQVHREWLIRSLEQVKTLTPVLISGIKIFITTKTSGQFGTFRVPMAPGFFSSSELDWVNKT